MNKGKIIRIRPHHLLCIGFFEGKGYSPEFTENMTEIICASNTDNEFMLTSGCDDVCASCPYFSGGECKTQEKVTRYDKAVTEILSAEPDRTYRFSDISEAVKEKIVATGKLSGICGDCEWAYICNKKQ